MKKSNSVLLISNTEYSPRRILITGGCGFVGANLVNNLLRKGFGYIRILDNLSTGSRGNLEDAFQEHGKIISKIKDNKINYIFKNILSKNPHNRAIIDLIIGDIKSHEICLKATRKIDVVVHLAAHAGVIPSIEDPFYDFKVNAGGTLNLLHASIQNGVDKFIFASSNAPIGDQIPPMNEEKVPKPLSPYGASKLAGEGYCSAFFSSYGLKTLTLRFSNVYGPYSTHKNSVIAEFFKKICDGNHLTIYGDGSQTRDFLFIDDLCNAVLKVINYQNNNIEGIDSSKVWGSIFQIASGAETSINNLFNKIKSLAEPDIKRKVNFKFEPFRKGEILRNYSDISLAKKILGYYPEFSLDEGLKITWNWFLKNYKKKSKIPKGSK
jgi:UDP-glucose 4-epimerase